MLKQLVIWTKHIETLASNTDADFQPQLHGSLSKQLVQAASNPCIVGVSKLSPPAVLKLP